MSNEKRTKQQQGIEDQLQGWDLAGKVEESAMSYIAYHEAKSWYMEEFFDSGAREVKEYTADFFRGMNFNPASKRMLDIGCGIGRMTRAFANIFSEAHGVDFSSNMIKLASELNKDKPNLYFKVNNGFDLSVYEANFFDFCFSFIAFQHIIRQEVVGNYIKEIDRVLKPGGLFMFQVNTDKWVIRKAFGWLPIHYRVRDFLYKIGFMRLYSRITTRDRVKAAIAPKTLPIYYM